MTMQHRMSLLKSSARQSKLPAARCRAVAARRAAWQVAALAVLRTSEPQANELAMQAARAFIIETEQS